MKNISKTIFVLIVIILVIILYQLSKSEITISPVPTPTATSTATSTPAAQNPAVSTSTTGTTVVVNAAPAIVQQSTAPCAFKVTYPRPNDRVTFPLTVHGVIDNSGTEPCKWNTFEGQAGDAQLYYDNAGLSWDPIGMAATIKPEKYTDPVTPFTVTLNYSNQGVGMKSGTKFLIRFSEENPKGGQAVEMFDVPVILR